MTRITARTNEIEIIFRSPNKHVAEKHEAEELFGATDALKGFMQLRKAHCMFGWDWGARLPDAGIWRDISLVRENSARLKYVRITQRHDGGKVFVTVNAEIDGGADTEIKITSPLGDVTSSGNACSSLVCLCKFMKQRITELCFDGFSLSFCYAFIR